MAATAKTTPVPEEEEEEEEFDPLRDGPLRYLGYANECGWVSVIQWPADKEAPDRVWSMLASVTNPKFMCMCDVLHM